MFHTRDISVDEQVQCDDDLSVYVRRWSPSEYTLGPFDEVVMHKDTSNAKLKKEVCRRPLFVALFVEHWKLSFEIGI